MALISDPHTGPAAQPDPREGALVWGALAVGIVAFAIVVGRSVAGSPFLSYGVSYMDYCLEPSWARFLSRMGGQTYYPPGIFTIVRGFCGLVGYDYLRVLAASAAFLPLAAVYLTALSRRLGFGRWAFVPGVLLLFFPATALAARTLTIEMPLLAALAAFAYHLHASAGLSRTRHALTAGLIAGLALLVKWTFAAYAIGLVLWFAARLFYDPEARRFALPRGRTWANLLLLAGLPAAMAGWWYALKMDWQTFVASSANDPNRLEFSYWRSLDDYLRIYGNATGAHLALALAAVFAVGAALSRRIALVVSLAVLGVCLPLGLFAIPVHGELRYLYPLLPASALAAGSVVATARWRAARMALAALLIAGVCWGHARFLGIEEHRGIVDFQNRTRVFVAYLVEHSAGRETKLEATVHPFWRNNHLKPEYLQYEVERARAREQVHVTFYRGLDYGRFRKRLYDGFYDVIFVDCGPDEDCDAARKDAIERTVRILDEFGNINQMTGERSPPFKVADVYDDLGWIRAHYRPGLRVVLADGTGTRAWVRDEATPDEPPISASPPGT